MPFTSQAQAGWAFANNKPFAKRWAKQTGPYKRLPRKVRKKAITVEQLEAFVSSPHYDPQTADAIAARIPLIPREKEQLAPGISRIHGNLCNVHGKYGPCDKAVPSVSVSAPPAASAYTVSTHIKPKKPKKGKRAAAKKPKRVAKPKAPPKPKHVAKPKAPPKPKVVAQPKPAPAKAPTPKQDAAGNRAVAQIAQRLGGTEQATPKPKRAPIAASAPPKPKRPARQAAKPAKPAKPGAVPTHTPRGGSVGSGSSPSVSSGGGAAAPKPSVPAKGPEKAPAPQIAQPLKDAAQALSDGADMTPAQVQSLVRNGLAKLDKDGNPVLTSAGLNATKKSYASESATKEQSDSERAMFAKMGSGTGGSKLYPRGPSGKRTPQAAAAAHRGGGGGSSSSESKPTVRMTGQGAGTSGRIAQAHDEQNRQAREAESNKKNQAEVTKHNASISVAQHDRSSLQTILDKGKHKGKPLTDQQRTHLQNEIARQDRIIVRAQNSIARIGTKNFTFRVFKDATGRARWVAQSSTAYQDRDQEIVSTKALTDDCAYADAHQTYGPLRWWHTPGLDLGDCDFNAMHGKVLIESGTFRSPAIAQKVAAAADALEISLGFLHLPTEPDASGVFHHIRKFERSLVPRGKASNRFTAFRVKDRPMFDPTKVAALKQLGFSDGDITELQARAEATEKAADDERIAFKADEPAELPDVVINGVTYKAFPAKGAQPAEGAVGASGMVEGSPEEEAAESPEEEAGEMAAGEGDAADAGGLTLSPDDISAIGDAVAQALQAALGPLVSTMDLTNKIGGHMDELKSMMGSYQTKKDSEQSERDAQVATLKATIDSTQAKLNELLGLQPEVSPRATATPATALNPFNPADNALLQSVKDQVPAEMQQQYANGFEDLKMKLFG